MHPGARNAVHRADPDACAEPLPCAVPCISGRKDRPPRVVNALSALFACTLILSALLSPAVAFARDDPAATPAHATTSRYGGRWDCDHGYRESNGTCTAVELPANAYATDSAVGAGWECGRGYKNTEESCVAIGVPENGYISAGRGDAWKCARGFRQEGKSCVAIVVPANGFLSTSSYGAGWECERGYRAVADTCLAVVVPANGHVNYSGTGWSCDRPFQKKHGVCELP